MSSEKKKEIKNVKITYEQFVDPDFVFPGTFYVLNALGEYHFFCTSSRELAQQAINDLYGAGRYSAVAAKIQKTNSRLESGEFSCRGSNTLKGFSSRLKGLRG